MIAFFRRTLASKLALGLLALVLLAFILTGVFTREMPGGGGGGGADGETLATVGGRKITVPEMEQRIRQQYARYAEQQPGLTMERFVATGGFDAIVDQTIDATALEMFGRKAGLVASERQIDGQIASVPAFQGATGKFDPAVYRAALAQQRISERSLREDIGGDIIRQMLFLPASGAVSLPKGLIAPYASLLVETRKGSIGFVPAAAMADGAKPTDAELAAFYKAHLVAYSTPERRVLRYAVVGRDQVAGKTVPTEAELRKAYADDAAKYAAHETRTLSQVVLPDQAAATAFAAKVKGGTGFAAAAQAAGFGAADIAIGAKTQAEFARTIGAPVAAAAFVAPEGGIAGPVKSAFGWAVVKVDKIEKTAAVPFEQARPQIAGDLAKAKQDKALADLVGTIQDALDDGQSFADVARRNGLTPVETPALTATGLVPDNPGWKPQPDLLPLLKPGFDAATDGTASLETVTQGERYALLAVGKVLRAAPIPLARVKERVAADFAAKRAADRAKAVADAILAKVKAGTSMAAAFAAAPVKLPAPREGSGRRIDIGRAMQGQVPASLMALFTMPRGGAKLVPGENGSGWYVVQLQSIGAPLASAVDELVQPTRGELVQTATNEYVEQLAKAAGESVGIERNAGAIAALKARLLGATPATAP